MKNLLTGKHRYTLLLGIILLFSFCAMIYFGHQKEGYHVDELYSYGLSNSEYLPFMHFGLSGYDVKDWMNEYGAGESLSDLCSNLIKDFRILKECGFDFYGSEIYEAYRIAQANSADTYTTTWVPGQDYVDYLTVSKSNTFNYASVYYNQRGDVHPPFFYILLHTICSVFQGQFSKWFGISLNITVLIITLVVLYFLSRRHLGEERLALAITAMYAFSSGFMSTAMFIRMYALLTLLTLLCCYVHLSIRQNDYEMNRKLTVALFFSILLGYYTQYYFVLYAIVLAAVTVVAMLYHRKFRALLKYLFTLAASALVGIAIWPFSIKHVFRGYRGRESLSILQTGSFYAYKAKYMLNHVFDYLFGGHLILPVLAVVVIVAVCMFLRKKNLPYGKICMITVPTVVYTLVVGQISPFLTDRYVMNTYPFWCMMFVCALYYAIRYLWDAVPARKGFPAEKYYTAIVLVITVLAVGANNYLFHTPGYLNPGGQETYQVPERTDCVFIIPDGSYNESSDECSILAQCRRVGVVYESNLEVLAADYQYQSGDYLLVEIINSLDEYAVLPKVQETMGVSDLKELDRIYGPTCVRILLGE